MGETWRGLVCCLCLSVFLPSTVWAFTDRVDASLNEKTSAVEASVEPISLVEVEHTVMDQATHSQRHGLRSQSSSMGADIFVPWETLAHAATKVLETMLEHAAMERVQLGLSEAAGRHRVESRKQSGVVFGNMLVHAAQTKKGKGREFWTHEITRIDLDLADIGREFDFFDDLYKLFRDDPMRKPSLTGYVSDETIEIMERGLMDAWADYRNYVQTFKEQHEDEPVFRFKTQRGNIHDRHGYAIVPYFTLDTTTIWEDFSTMMGMGETKSLSRQIFEKALKMLIAFLCPLCGTILVAAKWAEFVLKVANEVHINLNLNNNVWFELPYMGDRFPSNDVVVRGFFTADGCDIRRSKNFERVPICSGEYNGLSSRHAFCLRTNEKSSWGKCVYLPKRYDGQLYDPCDVHTDCVTGLCLDGFCRAACETTLWPSECKDISSAHDYGVWA